MSYSKRRPVVSCLTILVAGAIVVTMLFPFVWLISTSLKGMNEAFSFPPSLFPESAKQDNYTTVWKALPFGRFLLNSLFVAGAITCGQVISCVLAAYAFSRMSFPGRDILFFLYLSTIMLPIHVTDEIRTAEVDAIVSPVSVYAEVRKYMVEAQRAIAFDVDVVMDGRDIGTVVLAESAHKFYLTASPEERARRRQRDYARKGCHVELADLVDEINRRDEVDSTRQVSPLRPAPDAVLIDCTTLSPEEVVETMLAALGRPDACCIISQNP